MLTPWLIGSGFDQTEPTLIWHREAGDVATATVPIRSRAPIWLSSIMSLAGGHRRGYAWALSAGLNAALAAVSAKFVPSQVNTASISLCRMELRSLSNTRTNSEHSLSPSSLIFYFQSSSTNNDSPDRRQRIGIWFWFTNLVLMWDLVNLDVIFGVDWVSKKKQVVPIAPIYSFNWPDMSSILLP